ncbi:MAG TPA: hypothetical protein PK668_22565 [Myxococcota bacterium]|nr:hypothetical protein [Myxococcota bacterium]HRY95477.1 hypothetical protein [Myxococcota bacterium]HSA22207.1 hypothetical protein [Myxococcota bacterium]
MRARNPLSGNGILFGVIGVLAAWQGAGCERGPLELVCTPLQPGALVVTEVSSAGWHWIEIANPGASEIALTGMQFLFGGAGGTYVDEFWIREHDVSLAPGGRYVAARFPGSVSPPAWADYLFGDEFDADFPSSGILEIHNCDDHADIGAINPELVDRVQWSGLPETGSWAFDGGQAPNALANDTPTSWCQDSHSQTLGAGPYDTVLGSPGEDNPPCATP